MATKLKFNQRKISAIEKEMTQLVKSIIRQKQLIRTGDLHNSIETKVYQKNNNLSIQISGMDYWKYLDQPYDLSKDVFSSQQFKRISFELNDIYVEALMKNITRK